MTKDWVLLVSAVVISSVSQIILKKGALIEHNSVIKEYLNPQVMAGYGMMVVSTILIVFAYRGLDYKNGPIIEALGYFFVMWLSRCFLGEKITKKKLLGNTLILLGILIFYL